MTENTTDLLNTPDSATQAKVLSLSASVLASKAASAVDSKAASEAASPDAQTALDFARTLEQARALLVQNPLCRPTLYQILRACTPERAFLYPLEEHIQQLPEYVGLSQPPYFLIQWLLDVQALQLFELDDQGDVVDEQRKEGLSEDEIDDLIADFAFQTTEVGLVLLEEFNAGSRLRDLLAVVPERYQTYLELLEFLAEKRSYAEIDELLRGREVLMSGRAADDRPMQPSVFVDKLAAVGGIVYNQGWQTTADGKEFLERVKEEKSG